MANEDYASAAFRHGDDARRLHAAGRFDNAFYLSGYVVECALKVQAQLADLNPKSFSHDIGKLQLRLLGFAAEWSPSWARHEISWGVEMNAWDYNARYAPTGAASAARADATVGDAEAALEVLAGLVLDGTIQGVKR